MARRAPQDAAAPGERIAKRMARAGLCSRREAERWVRDGRVSIDGRVVRDPATNVTARTDVRVDGTPLAAPAPTRLWRYHKPRGLITTHKDPEGRPTVFDRLPREIGRVVSVGRLDLASEGLLLLTNDGALARRLERPATGWLRRYRVRAFGTVADDVVERLAAGITVDGMRYGPILVTLDRRSGRNAWLTASLAEGRNREVRRAFEHVGLSVNRLIRIAYGPFQLGTLARGALADVPRRVMRDQLGSLLSHADHRR